MSAEQTAAELTTRDVLLQVDRRLTLIEGDLRTLDEKLDDKIDGLRSDVDRRFTLIEGDLRTLDEKLDGKIDGLRTEMYAQFGTLRTELSAKLDSHLKWTLGTMAALIGLVVAVFKL